MLIELLLGIEEINRLLRLQSIRYGFCKLIAISDIDNFGTDAGLSIKIADEGELEDDPVTDLPWQGGI